MVLLDRGSSTRRKKGNDAFKCGTIENLAYVSSSIGAELQKQKPALVMLEDYSGGSTPNPFILAQTGEVTGVAKLWLHSSNVPWHEVVASTLKKFVTGSGSGKKEVMWLGAYKKWGVDQSTLGDSNNVLDGYCLARMGLAFVASDEQMPRYERECFKAMRLGGSARSFGKKAKKSEGIAP